MDGEEILRELEWDILTEHRFKNIDVCERKELVSVIDKALGVSEIMTLRDKIMVLGDEIYGLKCDISDLEDDIGDKNEEIKYKDIEISRLEEKLYD